jgi:hypothetical protein
MTNEHLLNPDLGPYNTESADRILGLGDQFIENWEADEGKDAEDKVLCAERRKEWDHYRPLFINAPKLLKALQMAAKDLGIVADHMASRRGQTADAVRAIFAELGVDEMIEDHFKEKETPAT